jgi:hypothetical protein
MAYTRVWPHDEDWNLRLGQNLMRYRSHRKLQQRPAPMRSHHQHRAMRALQLLPYDVACTSNADRGIHANAARNQPARTLQKDIFGTLQDRRTRNRIICAFQ